VQAFLELLAEPSTRQALEQRGFRPSSGEEAR
jgi:hypothetical protein